MSHYDDAYYFLKNYIFTTEYTISHIVNDFNYGMMNFKWGNNKEDSSVIINILDINNNIRLGREVFHKELVYNENYKDDIKCAELFSEQQKPSNNLFGKFKNKLKYHLFAILHIVLTILSISFLKSILYFIFNLFGFIFCFRRNNTKVDLQESSTIANSNITNEKNKENTKNVRNNSKTKKKLE